MARDDLVGGRSTEVGRTTFVRGVRTNQSPSEIGWCEVSSSTRENHCLAMTTSQIRSHWKKRYLQLQVQRTHTIQSTILTVSEISGLRMITT